LQATLGNPGETGEALTRLAFPEGFGGSDLPLPRVTKKIFTPFPVLHPNVAFCPTKHFRLILLSICILMNIFS
jgi:hypothetical protein